MIPSINTKKITASARGLFATIKEGFRTNTKDLSEVLLDKMHNPTPRSIRRCVPVCEHLSDAIADEDANPICGF